MKTRSLFLSAIICCLIFAGCNSDKSKLSKVWFHNLSDDSSLNAGSFINIMPDGTYTSYLYSFEYGTWGMNGKTLSLNNQRNEVKKLEIKSLDKEEMVFTLTGGRSDGAYTFYGSSNKVKDEKHDPFSRKNNEWRIPASHKESDAELVTRLKSHFHFWEAYFDWAMAINKQSLEVRAIPTPLKIYGNGFELKSFDQLSQDWIFIFFDKDDCRKSNEIITRLFETNNINWPDTESKYKMFLSAFVQLQRQLK